MNPNYLSGLYCYVARPMDRTSDGGLGFSELVGPVLNKLGVKILDPTKKQLKDHIIDEDIDNRANRKIWKKNGDYQKVYEMRYIRSIDLRLVDRADFLIAELDMNKKPFGVIEEIVTANRSKKPIYILLNDKTEVPDWLIWMIGYETIFDNLYDFEQHLLGVNSGKIKNKRWVFIKG